MLLLDADFKVVARMTARRKAPLAQQEELAIRTRRNGVRGVDGAPEFDERE